MTLPSNPPGMPFLVYSDTDPEISQIDYGGRRYAVSVRRNGNWKLYEYSQVDGEPVVVGESWTRVFVPGEENQDDLSVRAKFIIGRNVLYQKYNSLIRKLSRRDEKEKV